MLDAPCFSLFGAALANFHLRRFLILQRRKPEYNRLRRPRASSACHCTKPSSHLLIECSGRKYSKHQFFVLQRMRIKHHEQNAANGLVDIISRQSFLLSHIIRHKGRGVKPLHRHAISQRWFIVHCFCSAYSNVHMYNQTTNKSQTKSRIVREQTSIA